MLIHCRLSVSDAVVRVRDESGIQFEDEPGFRETKTGIKATARFRILNRSSASPVKIELDLTGPDQERVLLPVSRRPIFHPYSDKLEASVISYSLAEIMAEKIRSLFQRTRSRDLYDTWQLADRVNQQDVRSILRQKCESKEVAVDTATLIVKRDWFRAIWRVSLGHQMNKIPDFDDCFHRLWEKSFSSQHGTAEPGTYLRTSTCAPLFAMRSAIVRISWATCSST